MHWMSSVVENSLAITIAERRTEFGKFLFLAMSTRNDPAHIKERVRSIDVLMSCSFLGPARAAWSRGAFDLN
jgi:hypothetical protein